MFQWASDGTHVVSIRVPYGNVGSTCEFKNSDYQSWLRIWFHAIRSPLATFPLVDSRPVPDFCSWMRLLALALSYNPDVYCPTLGTGRRRFSVPWNRGAPCPFRPYFFSAEQCLLVGWSLYSLWSGPSLAQRLLPRVHSDTFYAILKLFLLTMLGSGAPMGINLEEVLYNSL